MAKYTYFGNVGYRFVDNSRVAAPSAGEPKSQFDACSRSCGAVVAHCRAIPCYHRNDNELPASVISPYD